jgi:hypothetical protein
MAAIKKEMKGLSGDALAQMQKMLAAVEAKLPDPLPALYSVTTDASKSTPIHVLARGDWQNKGEAVGMRPLGILLPDGTSEWTTKTPRADLANWIVDSENPLTARVVVNRIWQFHFGRGIVATPNDFGRMGARPTHPELLDYLANRFIDGGWHWKPLHREILLSNTYQQAGTSPLAKIAEQKDPENTLLWRFSRRRLEAEEMRDAMLQAAGLLNPKQGGPSIIVPVDKDLINDLYKPSQWTVTPDQLEHNRRSIYLIAKRNLRLPFMQVFDAPDFLLSCARRESSTHAPQALEMLNGDLSNRLAGALAERLVKEAGPNRTKQIDLAYRLSAGRMPTAKERQIAERFLQTQPLREFALAILNLNDFLYVN